MNDKTDDLKQPSRRKFVKTSAQVAVTAPAVAVLLSATTKQAFASTGDPDSYGLGGHATGSGDVGTAADDPNHNEDIDFCHGNAGGTIDDSAANCAT